MKMKFWSYYVYAMFVLACASHGVDAQFNLTLDSLDGVHSTGLGYLYKMVDQFLEVVLPSGGATLIGALNDYR